MTTDPLLQEQCKSLGIHIPTILLPKKGVELKTWATVACDQYTSEPQYWNEVERLVGENPSTLRITLPEIYLEEQDVEGRIEKINATMQSYLESGILIAQKPGMIFVNRKTSHAKSRKGLIIALDLEKYEYSKGSKTLIRATEGTVVERLPPRIKIREHAPIELPHIMVLIDDPKKTVIEQVVKFKKKKKVYDTDLMMGGGHIKGQLITQETDLLKITQALHALANPETYKKKYGVEDDNVLLFAMGDGNHSLATAKAIWEEKKKTLTPEAKEIDPARYALVELVNVHDAGLKFEPIHRVLFNIDYEKFIAALKAYYTVNNKGVEFIKIPDAKKRKAKFKKLCKDKTIHAVEYIMPHEQGILVIKGPTQNLAVGSLQSFLDIYLKQESNVKIDYVHGDDVTVELGLKQGNSAFLLPVMPKTELFRTVILDGVLPRKTFSMGHADEKRFYMEARKIV